MPRRRLLEAALALSEKDRIELVERLLETLEAQTDGADEEIFATELRRRSEEIDEGKGDLIPWSELKDEPF